ncbi:histidine phosphatase family protein [Solibacillus sp. CAU 1738]|uniref:histidine phosphatase family protein n=1 Tax=Solibacillus sp. CAU 1738 TaxID=3140363 RepID=UPI003261C9FD
MGNAVTIHLIRHGKTQANIERKYIGHTDEPLVNVEAVNMPLDAKIVYGSDLLRCKQTANLYFPNANYVANSNLRELDFGHFEMKTYEDLKNDAEYRAWVTDPENVTPPDGESFQHFKKRVFTALTDIICEQGNYTFIIHGGVIRVWLAAFLHKPFQDVTAKHDTIYTCSWKEFFSWKEGTQCTSISEVPITVKESL